MSRTARPSGAPLHLARPHRRLGRDRGRHATDFIPGVAQAKTAYDAYQRIQNGEDLVDVLTAAGGDAVLGLIPGFKPAKKLGKAFDKAEDVADAAGNVKGQVLKRDLTKGPHAPDTPIGKVIDRAQSTGKPQGRWTSTEAAERAAGRAREGQKTVPIAPGDGTVLHALPNGGVMIREATQAITVPKQAGNKAVWHTYPVD